MINEKTFFFETSNNIKLKGFIHLPNNNKCTFGIVYVHPFGEEQNCSYSIVVKTAREIAKIGIPVLRFDMRGFGDSEGRLEDFVINDWLDDIANAINYFKKTISIEKVGLWGLRFGAALNILVSLKRDDIIFNIFWQPVFDFEKYIHQLLRQKLSADIVEKTDGQKTIKSLILTLEKEKQVEIAGYTVSFDLYNSFKNTGNIRDQIKLSDPIYLASVSLMEQPPFEISNFVKYLENKPIKFSFSHIKSEPFWDRYWQWDSKKLMSKTVEWLQSDMKEFC